MSTPHGLTGVADAGAFLARLTRLDPSAVARLRAVAPGRVALWARLPWGVLVSRTVDGDGPQDATVSAAELLTELSRGGGLLPVRRDRDWRWPLPPSAGRVAETLAGADLRQVAAAAAGTLRTAETAGLGGRAVGQRMLRDALLDHVAIVVTAGPSGPAGSTAAAAGAGAGAGGAGGEVRVEVPQRLVQGVVRMGFLGAAGAPDSDVHVRVAGRWVGLSAPYGVAWLQKVTSLAVRSTSNRTNG